MSNTPFVGVVLDEQKTKPLDYRVPLHLQDAVAVGMRVEVPFRTQVKKGTIVCLKSASSVEAPKELLQVLGQEVQGNLWKLAEWISQYYFAPLQQVLRCFIPPSIRKGVQPKKEWRYVLAISKTEAVEQIVQMRSKAPKQAELLELIANAPDGFQGKSSALQSLIDKKWVKKVEFVAHSLEGAEFFPSKPKTLNGEQELCLGAIRKTLEKGEFGVHLIQGVTGSGKTEIYLQAIQETLQKGKTAIMLVPEISLTSQTIERFRSRFPNKIAIWHHKRSLGERTKAWEEMSSGVAEIVIGARSAIFCPIQKLGLVIVDEEHDGSYKQSEEAPCYHGRDVAIMRAYLEQAVVLLGSATPSLESRRNAEIGKYQLSKLTERAGNSTPAKVTIVDMQQTWDRQGGFTHFSPPLLEGLKRRVELGEQTLLFLNKRGYHRLQVCAGCKQTVKCPHCDLGLTYHKAAHVLRCHVCNFQRSLPDQCPSCGSRESLQFKGFGTEHVERSLKAIFPQVRTLRMDRDTTQQKETHEAIYQAFRAHKADVLIGTQMIAKGFHFPSVTLVGILNADPGLHIPDFRSAEQMFQLITQVSGRAGRSDLPGEVILQTLLPDHPIIQLAAKQNYDPFYEREIVERKQFHFPPFCHLIKICFFGKNLEEVENQSKNFYESLLQKAPPGVTAFPPLPSGHAKIKDLYRFHLLVKTPKISLALQAIHSLPPYKNIKIDVDPISTFF